MRKCQGNASRARDAIVCPPCKIQGVVDKLGAVVLVYDLESGRETREHP